MYKNPRGRHGVVNQGNTPRSYTVEINAVIANQLLYARSFEIQSYIRRKYLLNRATL